MTPFLLFRIFRSPSAVSVRKRSCAPQDRMRRLLATTVAALAAAASAPALFAQGDMESDLLPNTTLFFDELQPSPAAVEEAEILTDLARIFDQTLLDGNIKEKDLDRLFEMAAKHPCEEAFFSPLVQAVTNPRLHDKVLPRLLELADTNPDSRELNLTAGELLIQDGRMDDAVPYLERAFDVVRKDPEPQPPSQRRREYNANIAAKLVLVYSDRAFDKKRRDNAELADEVSSYREKVRAVRAEIEDLHVFDNSPEVRSALIISCAGEMEITKARSPLSTSVLVPFDENAWRLRDEMNGILRTTLNCLLDRPKEVEEPEFPAPFRLLCNLGYTSQVMGAALTRLAEAPDDTEALFVVATIADELKDPLLGALAWERIFAIVKNPTPAMYAICASLQMEAKLYDEAEQTYRFLAMQIDEPILVKTKLAQVEFERGKYRKALEILREAPNDAERFLLETDCHMRLRNYQEALNTVQKAVRITPALLNSRRFRLVCANIADKAGDMKYVEEVLAPRISKRLPAVADDDIPEAELYNSLGYIFADHGYKLREALVYIMKAVELAPDNGAIADSYAWVLFRLKRFEEAKKEILRAIELLGDDVDATITDHAGDIFFALGDSEAARKYWEQALDLTGDVDFEAIERKLSDVR